MIPVSDIYKDYEAFTASLPLTVYNRRKLGLYKPYEYREIFTTYPYLDGIASTNNLSEGDNNLMQQYLFGIPKQVTPELIANGLTQSDMFNPLLEFELFGHTFQMRFITFVHIDQPFESYCTNQSSEVGY